MNEVEQLSFIDSEGSLDNLNKLRQLQQFKFKY